MSERNSPLEPSADEMRSFTQRVLDLLVENIEGLDHSPASLNTPSAELLAEVSQPPPQAPGDLGVLLDRVTRAAEQSYQTAGPSYLAYIPGGGIYTSALAGFLAAGLNRFTAHFKPAQWGRSSTGAPSSHFLQSSRNPSICSRPAAVVTQ